MPPFAHKPHDFGVQARSTPGFPTLAKVEAAKLFDPPPAVVTTQLPKPVPFAEPLPLTMAPLQALSLAACAATPEE